MLRFTDFPSRILWFLVDLIPSLMPILTSWILRPPITFLILFQRILNELLLLFPQLLLLPLHPRPPRPGATRFDTGVAREAGLGFRTEVFGAAVDICCEEVGVDFVFWEGTRKKPLFAFSLIFLLQIDLKINPARWAAFLTQFASLGFNASKCGF